MKNYIGFSNDHSGSMGHIAKAAARDFNATVAAIQSAAQANSIDTIVNVVQCGIRTAQSGAAVVRQVVNSNIQALKPIAESSYLANGHATPLFDSVGELISMLKAVPDYDNPDVSFLVFVTTDGGENSSRKWTARTLANEIRELQNTDRWTFVFRVPRGHASSLKQQGIPEGNIQEWDQSDRGFQASTQATTQAFNDYYSGRTKGVRGTSTFFSNLANVSVAEVKANLVDISGEVVMIDVLPRFANSEIRPFVESHINGPMLKGAAFYQLTKTESKIQDTKMVVIRDRKTGSVYFGQAARQMIGLPQVGNARVHPGNHGNFDIFIQSTSVNRKLMGNTKVMYWPKVGKAFTEGPSYQPAQAAAVAKQSLPSSAPVVLAPAPVINAVPATPVAKTPAPVKPNNGQVKVFRKKDGVLVATVNSVSEAQALIDKAKRQKKASLYYVI